MLPLNLPPFTRGMQVDDFLDYMLEINKHMNLTAKTMTKAEAMDRHINDSLALLPIIERNMPRAKTSPIRIIDVGTGAGLPGVVLAIAR